MIAFEHGSVVRTRYSDNMRAMCVTGIFNSEEGTKYLCEWVENQLPQQDIFKEESLVLYVPLVETESYYLE